MIRVSAQKSELQAESRSYRPKVRVTAGETPRIRTESPKKGTRMGFRCFYSKTPPKAFLNPAKLLVSDVAPSGLRILCWLPCVALETVLRDEMTFGIFGAPESCNVQVVAQTSATTQSFGHSLQRHVFPKFKPFFRTWGSLELLLGQPRTTLECSPPLDERELLTRGIPQSIRS